MRAMAIAFGVALAACSTAKTKHPAELGGCVPSPDAACARPSAGAGSTLGNPDANAVTLDASSSANGGCVDAGSLVATMNTTCHPCIAANCCTNQGCSGDCGLLLQWAQGCQGDTGCLGVGETMYPPSAVTSYRDFAQCLSLFCPPPECPALPLLP
ncbi:MAG: hypothetical protein M3O46_12455 [Myxococcota bacterium]|nr:hypothetical protein [Myxococcota bacterium]